jgi:hypothetical protein
MLKTPVRVQLPPPDPRGEVAQGPVGLDPLDVGAGHGAHPVDLPVLQGEELGAGVGDDPLDEAVEVGEPGPEVGRVPDHLDLLDGVALQLERPGADRRLVGRAAGDGHQVGAPLIDVLGDDRRLGDVQLLQERGVGVREAEDDGVGVRRLEGDLSRPQGRLGARVQLQERPLEGELDVVGGEGPAVVPCHAAAEVELVGRAPALDRPAGGQLGNELAVRPPAHQAVEQHL